MASIVEKLANYRDFSGRPDNLIAAMLNDRDFQGTGEIQIMFPVDPTANESGFTMSGVVTTNHDVLANGGNLARNCATYNLGNYIQDDALPHLWYSASTDTAFANFNNKDIYDTGAGITYPTQYFPLSANNFGVNFVFGDVSDQWDIEEQVHPFIGFSASSLQSNAIINAGSAYNYGQEASFRIHVNGRKFTDTSLRNAQQHVTVAYVSEVVDSALTVSDDYDLILPRIYYSLDGGIFWHKYKYSSGITTIDSTTFRPYADGQTLYFGDCMAGFIYMRGLIDKYMQRFYQDLSQAVYLSTGGERYAEFKFKENDTSGHTYVYAVTGRLSALANMHVKNEDLKNPTMKWTFMSLFQEAPVIRYNLNVNDIDICASNSIGTFANFFYGCSAYNFADYVENITWSGVCGQSTFRNMYALCTKKLSTSFASTYNHSGPYYVSNYACHSMFSGCTSLSYVNRMDLKQSGNTTVRYAFGKMFAHTALSAMPYIDFIQCKNYYNDMSGSTVKSACEEMFAYCTNLRDIYILPEPCNWANNPTGYTAQTITQFNSADSMFRNLLSGASHTTWDSTSVNWWQRRRFFTRGALRLYKDRYSNSSAMTADSVWEHSKAYLTPFGNSTTLAAAEIYYVGPDLTIGSTTFKYRKNGSGSYSNTASRQYTYLDGANTGYYSFPAICSSYTATIELTVTITRGYSDYSSMYGSSYRWPDYLWLAADANNIEYKPSSDCLPIPLHRQQYAITDLPKSNIFNRSQMSGITSVRMTDYTSTATSKTYTFRFSPGKSGYTKYRIGWGITNGVGGSYSEVLDKGTFLNWTSSYFWIYCGG